MEMLHFRIDLIWHNVYQTKLVLHIWQPECTLELITALNEESSCSSVGTSTRSLMPTIITMHLVPIITGANLICCNPCY